MTATPWSLSHEVDAPTSPVDMTLYTTHAPSWSEGMECVATPVSIGADSSLLAVLVGVMVLIGLNIQHVKRIFKSVPQDLFSIRRRANVFDEHTANESRVMVLLLLQMCVYQGLLLFMWHGNMAAITNADQLTHTVLALAVLALGYYIFGITGCITLGYVFTDKVNAGLLRRGFNASQTLLSIALIAPTVISLFYPGLTNAMLITAAVMYVVSRICYISKGFRIFYHNFPSLLYFILYLCTLEIIPVIIACLLAREICGTLN